MQLENKDFEIKLGDTLVKVYFKAFNTSKNATAGFANLGYYDVEKDKQTFFKAYNDVVVFYNKEENRLFISEPSRHAEVDGEAKYFKGYIMPLQDKEIIERELNNHFIPKAKTTSKPAYRK